MKKLRALTNDFILVVASTMLAREIAYRQCGLRSDKPLIVDVFISLRNILNLK